MQTDTIAAWQVEEGDLITLGSDATFTVRETRDTPEGVDVNLENDEGDVEAFSFHAFESITLVVSLDDDDEDEVDSES